MVLRSVSCQQGNHKYDKYVLELWILQGKNENSQGVSVFHWLVVNLFAVNFLGLIVRL